MSHGCSAQEALKFRRMMIPDPRCSRSKLPRLWRDLLYLPRQHIIASIPFPNRAFNMALLLRQRLFGSGLPKELLMCTIAATSRSFSVVNRPSPNYHGHIPLTRIEKAGLAVGSAVISLLNPRRPGTFIWCVHD